MTEIVLEKYNYSRIPAGWRNWLILNVKSMDGYIGYAEFSDSNGSEKTLLVAIEEIGSLLIGKKINSVQDLVLNLRKKYRQVLPGIMFKAISAFENALWDLQSKRSGMLIAELLQRKTYGSESRNFKCYWSHCPTTRIRAHQHINSKPIVEYSDLEIISKEISRLNFSAFKTNLVQIKPKPKVWMPGFNKNLDLLQDTLPQSYPEELANILKTIMGGSEELECIVDLNYNVDLLGFQAIQNSLSELNVRWLEIDFDDFNLYNEILIQKKIPICTGENLLGLNHFEKVIFDERISIVSIDVLWNGLTESLKIAELSIKSGKKIAVHNYNGSLATSISLVFLSMLPAETLELMEFDFDDVYWRDSIVTNPPKFSEGSFNYIPGLGWNNNPLSSQL